MDNKPTVLFVDDEIDFSRDFSKDLARLGFTVVNAFDSNQLRQKIDEHEEKEPFDLIILDLMMPDKYGRFSIIAGIEDLKFLKQEKKMQTPVIVLSALPGERIKSEVMRFGAYVFLGKTSPEATERQEGSWLHNILKDAVAQNISSKNREENKTRAGNEEVEVTYSLQFSMVPTSIYMNYDFEEFPRGLIRYSIKNNSDDEKEVSISTQIERFSDPQNTRHRLKPHQAKYVTHSPLLIHDEVSKIKEIEKATLSHSFTILVNGRLVAKSMNSETLSLQTLSTLYWAMNNVETHRTHYMGNYIAAWVTPKATAVEEMLRLAVDHHPKEFILGYQAPEGISTDEKSDIVRMQIDAIYNALKEEGKIKYIDGSTISFEGTGSQFMQKVRLPDETLKLASANCLDGAVLFASLIECAGMNPVILLVPHHALVGWEIWKDTGHFEYLETTMLSKHGFEEALAEGNSKFNECQVKDWFKGGRASVINIREARARGIYPFASR
jgi:CheY-like chemotaxis protein